MRTHPEPAPRRTIHERERRQEGSRGGGRPASFIEPGRLSRAVSLAITKLGLRQYRVQGQDEPHYDVSLDTDPPCYCRDQEVNGRRLHGRCKHVISALLQERDPLVVNAVVERFERQLKILREAGLETET